jgi:Type IV secretion-system coupling protein DNA-binding domain
MTTGNWANGGAAQVSILEGMTIGPQPQRAGAPYQASERLYVLPGNPGGAICFDAKLLSRHALFLGGIGTGKTNAMKQLVRALRAHAGPDDVFVVFDTKGDFYEDFYRPGDAVISSDPGGDPGGVTWNLFADLAGGDGGGARGDQIYEVAATVFGAAPAGENAFFGAAARDIFAAVVEIMLREGGPLSNADLRDRLEDDAGGLLALLEQHPDLAGTARYLQGERTPEAILAFLQQTLNGSFAGPFRRPGGTFSVRDFVRGKAGRALFIEYDIAAGSRLLPVYRVLMDLAIKEALSLGRRRAPGSVYFLMDEFALLPQLTHISDGINFGRGLGLKFIVGTQNVSQVLHAYGAETGSSILSGFGTVFAFRLMDDASRALVRQRFGGNRKQITTYAAIRAEGVQHLVVDGSVIEDWDVSALQQGRCVVSLPDGPPFFFAFHEYPGRGG